MTMYKEPFKTAWSKILKTDIFPNLLANIQPINISINVGTGWDWLSKVPVEDTIVNIEINEEEIIQCNYNNTGFICYCNFGKGYKFLEIPYESIDGMSIGNHTNWIRNPIPSTPFNLKEETIYYLNDEKEIE